MKNRRIPGLPSPEDQDTMQFYFFKSLSYSARMLLYVGFIITGFIIQILTLRFLPGALLLILAVLLNLVRGYNSKPVAVSSQKEGDWIKTDMDRVYKINEIKQSINKWDRDALDISNGMGCGVFGVVAVGLILIFFYLSETIGEEVAGIFIGNALFLIISLWFNGMRVKYHQDILYLKTDMVVELEKTFSKIKRDGENFIPSLVLVKDKQGKDFPTDIRFNITFDNAPADFYGIQAQININVVSTNYPYFYCVITSKSGFGLGRYVNSIDTQKNIIKEYSQENEAEVIVIRQKTTKSTGYHTKIATCKSILETALTMARLIKSV